MMLTTADLDHIASVIDDLLADRDLPPGVQAALLTTRTAATGTTAASVAVWGPAARHCAGCDQHDRDPIRDCPVSLDPSFGAPQVWSQQHGCGTWWGPPWETINLDGLVGIENVTDAVLGTARRIEADVAGRDAELRSAVVESLRSELTAALADLAAGADPVEVTTGNELEPGVWHFEGRWEAWDYDPSSDAEGDTITVTEADLHTDRPNAGR